MYRSLAVNDTGEAEDIQERVKRKKLEDAREGKAKGGRRTYGYGKVIGNDPATGKEVRDPYQQVDAEVAILQEGKRRTLAGDSQFTIVRDWNERGLQTTLAGQKTKYRGKESICDGRWDVGKFKRTLLNESYIIFDRTGHPADCPCLRNDPSGGTRIHYNERHRAKWPGIFTVAEHRAMVAVFNGRDKYWSNSGHIRRRTYLLSGTVYCGGTWRDTERVGQPCGGQMYGQGKTHTNKAGQKRYERRYACKKWDGDGSRIGCCSVFRIADAVEAYVTEQVLQRFSSPHIAEALAPPGSDEEMADVVRHLAHLRLRRQELAAEYAAGEHDKADYQVMLRSIKDQIIVAEADEQRLLADEVRRLAIPFDGGLPTVWSSASLEWRASVIKLVVDKVIIHPGRPGAQLWPDSDGWRFDPSLVEIVWLR